MQHTVACPNCKAEIAEEEIILIYEILYYLEDLDLPMQLANELRQWMMKKALANFEGIS